MFETSLTPVTRSPLYEQVEKRLREFIDAQNLKPGDRLMSERELAERLSVSRTSVRQALTALRVRGLVEIRHGDGIYVLRSVADVIPSLALELLHSEVDHPMIWEVREGLETQAARLAARRRTSEDLQGMRESLDAMAASIAAGGEGVVGDQHFHRAVVEAAKNALLSQLMAQISDTVDRTSEASLSLPGRPPVSLRAHELILAAIEAGDEDLAARRMHEHIAVSAEGVHARARRDAAEGAAPPRRAARRRPAP